MRRYLLLTFVLLPCLLLHAQQPVPLSSEPEFLKKGVVLYPPSEPPMLEAVLTATARPIISLNEATDEAAEALTDIAAWNGAGRIPTKTGIARPLSAGIEIDLERIGGDAKGLPDLGRRLGGGSLVAADEQQLVWAATLQVRQAWRLRLQLQAADLPDQARLWVIGADGESVGPFSRELLDENGQMWTPSVAGPDLTLVAQLPRGVPGNRFEILGFNEQFRLDQRGRPVDADLPMPQSTDCLEEVSCFSTSTFAPINQVRTAVGLMSFMQGGESFTCSGTLINDTDPNSIRLLFLSANHCLSTQPAAASLEVFWDYRTSTCNGAPPSLGSRPRSNGSVMLATAASHDYTYLELNNVPGGRVLLGFDASPLSVGNGATLHRISHPMAMVQHYSQTQVSNAFPACQSLPKPNYIYSALVIGGTAQGSSGSAVLTPSGSIAGQLYGGCGSEPEDDCSELNATVDGSLSDYFLSVSHILSPQPGQCTPIVSVPNGGEEWQRGSVQTIRWSAASCGATVRIELLDGNQVTPIANSTNNDGVLNWQIPPDLALGSNYRVRVSSLADPDDNDSSDAPFSITILQQPDLLIEALDASNGTFAGGELINVSTVVTNAGNLASSAYRIRFYASGNDSISTSDAFLGFQDRPGIGAGESDLFDQALTLPVNLNDGQYYIGAIITVSDGNSANNSGIDPDPITVITPQTCSYLLDYPDGGELLPAGSTQDLTWFSIGGACADTVRLTLVQGGEDLLVIAPETPNDGRFIWQVPISLLSGEDYRLRINDTDDPGLFVLSASDFTIANPLNPELLQQLRERLDELLGNKVAEGSIDEQK